MHRVFLLLLANLTAIPGPCHGQPPEPSPVAVADWLQELEREAETGGGKAAFSFQPASAESLADVRTLIAGLRHRLPYVRMHVAVALGEIDGPVEHTAPALIAAIRDEDQEVRRFATAALIQLGPAATPYLATAMADATVIEEPGNFGTGSSSQVADYAAFALSRAEGAIIPSCADVLKSQLRVESQNRQLNEFTTLEREIAGLAERLDSGTATLAFTERLELEDRIGALQQQRMQYEVAENYLRRVAATVRSRGDRDVDDLRPLLEHDQTAFQRMALLSLGPETAEMVPVVTELLYGDNKLLHRDGLDALRRMGPPAAESIARAVLAHPSEIIRQAAAEVAPTTEPALRQMIQAIRESDELKVQIAVARSLRMGIHHLHSLDEQAGTTGTVAPSRLEQAAVIVLVKTLDNESSELRLESARALAEIATKWHSNYARILPRLIECFRNADAELRAPLARVFGAFGAQAEAALPVMLEKIRPTPSSPNANLSTESLATVPTIRAIGDIGVATDEAVSTLLEILRSEAHRDQREKVVAALGMLRAHEAIPEITKYFSRADTQSAWMSAADALFRIDPTALAALTELLATQSTSFPIRQRACIALSNPRFDGPGVRTALKAAAADSDPRIRLEAALGLAARRTHEEMVIPILVERFPYLQGGTYRMRQALDSLKAYGDDGSAALTRCLKAIAEGEASTTAAFSEEDAKRYADGIQALGEMKTNREESIKLVMDALHHENLLVCRAAAKAARSVRPENPQAAIKSLVGLLNRDIDRSVASANQPATGDSYVRSEVIRSVLEALESYGTDAAPAIPLLIRLLEHHDATLRQQAAKSLGIIAQESDDQRVRAALLTRRADPSLLVSETAEEALLVIGVEPESLGPSFVKDGILRFLDGQLKPFSRNLSNELHRRRTFFSTSKTYFPTSLNGDTLPPLPWPPPRPTQSIKFGADGSLLPRRLLGDDDTTLEVVYDRLYRALLSVDEGFESGLFGVGEDGFALLAKLERIDENGSPMPGSYRWTYGELPPLSIRDYFGRLFFEKPGYYRVVAFVITPRKLLRFSDSLPPDISHGGADLPRHIAERKLGEQNCYALIYSYKRVPGGRAVDFEKLGALQHLRNAGIVASLEAL